MVKSHFSKKISVKWLVGPGPGPRAEGRNSNLFDLSSNHKKHLKKSLQVWLPELFFGSPFSLKTANL